jgi:WD40 repeat protein
MWQFPNFHDSQPIIIPTEHRANIFGIQFLPQSGGPTKLVTGAADHSVQVHECDHNNLGSITTQYNCHRARIKEIQVHPEEPSLFWTVSEDGTSRQIDLRIPTSDQDSFESKNVLLAVQRKTKSGRKNSTSSRSLRSSFEHQHQNNVAAATATAGEPVVYRSFSRTQQDQFNARTNLAELKSLALNPLRSMQIAVAASDEHIRIYDRRKLSVGSFDAAAMAASYNNNTSSSNSNSNSTLPAGLVTELIPPHFAMASNGLAAGGAGGGRGTRDVYPTSIQFSNSGDKLLANYHNNHAFMFSTPNLFAGASDAATVPANITFNRSGNESGKESGKESGSGCGWNFNKHRPSPAQRKHCADEAGPCRIGPYNLPPAAETHRLAANLALYDREYMKALFEYNKALRIAPNSTVLLTGRALVLLSRAWMGDKIEALRDAEEAVYYDFENAIGHLRRAQALFECSLLQSAGVAIHLCRLICYQVDSNGSHVNKYEGSCDYEDELRRLEEKLREKMSMVEQQKMIQQREREREKALRRRHGLNLQRRSPRPSGEYSHRNSSDNNNTAAAAAAAAEEAPPRSSSAPPPPSATAIDEEELQQQSKYCSDEEDFENEDERELPFLERLDTAFAESLEKDYQSVSKTLSSSSSSSSISPLIASSSWLWGALPSSESYLNRFVGHCNVQTDIKEAVFIGDSFVAAGSDDGRMYLYDASSGVCLRTLKGDDDIVNCIRPHPHTAIIASSGIDSTVKLWSPSSIGMALAQNEVEACCAMNQTTLTQGDRHTNWLNERLFQILTQHPGLRGVTMDLGHGTMVGGPPGHIPGEDEDEQQPPIECRVS